MDGRKNMAYDNMTKIVRKRDCNRCQFPDCKYRGKKIEVHHITTYASCISLRYEPKNNICLCYKHHNMIKNKESYYAAMFNTIIDSKY